MDAQVSPLRRRLNCSLVAMIVALGSTGGAERAGARDCSIPEEAAACSSNEDCVCGVDLSESCTVGARECVSTTTGVCHSFCGGYGDLKAVCRAGRCVRAARTYCPGDCDGDAYVQIPELVTGVAIAMRALDQAACKSFDRDASDGTEVGELIAGVAAALRGCAQAVPRDADDRGVYDGMIDSSGELSGFSGAVADVRESNDGLGIDLAVAPNMGFYVSGPLNGSDLMLDGYFWITDYGVPTSGSATIEDLGDERVIEGSLESPRPPGAPAATTFTLRHSDTANPARFAGHYHFATPQSPRGNGRPSSFDFDLLVAADGVALSTEGRDLGADEELYGRLVSGTCRVAPQGHFRCRTFYLIEGSDLTTPLGLVGVLPEAGSAQLGVGSLLSGSDPPFGPQPYVPSTWTATRD